MERAERVRLARVSRAAHRQMVKALVRARLRYWARCVPAALVAAPVGVVGIATTWLGRKLGWQWLQHPGRRLFRAMTAQAKRDLAVESDLARTVVVDDDEDDEEIADRVPRGRSNPQEGTAGMNESNDGNFGFAQAAEEMEQAAQKYDPDGMLEVAAALKSLPQGLSSIARVFALLVERSDQEYPLDRRVGEALNDIHNLLVQAATGAQEIGKVFDDAHQADLQRLHEPRNGEEKWNYRGE